MWQEGGICANWTQLISRCGQKVGPYLQYWYTGTTVYPHRLISCVQLAQNCLPYPPCHTLFINLLLYGIVSQKTVTLLILLLQKGRVFKIVTWQIVEFQKGTNEISAFGVIWNSIFLCGLWGISRIEKTRVKKSHATVLLNIEIYVLMYFVWYFTEFSHLHK